MESGARARVCVVVTDFALRPCAGTAQRASGRLPRAARAPDLPIPVRVTVSVKRRGGHGEKCRPRVLAVSWPIPAIITIEMGPIHPNRATRPKRGVGFRAGGLPWRTSPPVSKCATAAGSATMRSPQHRCWLVAGLHHLALGCHGAVDRSTRIHAQHGSRQRVDIVPRRRRPERGADLYAGHGCQASSTPPGLLLRSRRCRRSAVCRSASYSSRRR